MVGCHKPGRRPRPVAGDPTNDCRNASSGKKWTSTPSTSRGRSRARVDTAVATLIGIGIENRDRDRIRCGLAVGGLRIPLGRLTFDPSQRACAIVTSSVFSGFPFSTGNWRLSLGIEARL
jgi:hypothetical protein